MSQKHAIIDIGSNTVRLVVYGGPPRAPAVLLNEKVTARLGKSVGETGRLSNKAMKTALAALARFATLLEVSGVTRVTTAATAASRDAVNGPEFLAAVAELGLAPRLLSGEEEALTSAQGVMAAFPGMRGIVADLGGGSLELTRCNGQSCQGGITTPFGTLRLPAARADGPRKFASKVRAALRDAGWSDGRGQPLYLVGGSWRALARVAMARLHWPLDDPHGFELDPKTALNVCRSLARGKAAVEAPRISASRLASLPDAAALLAVLVREIEPSCLIFSSWGLREGLLYETLDADVRAEDPALAGVAAFARTMDVDPDVAAAVDAWIAPVCDATSKPGADNALRRMAALLALAAVRIEPNLRADEAVGWAMRKRWIGLDARGRALLAMTALANTGAGPVADLLVAPGDLIRLASAADLRQAATWGLAIRLCRKFTGCAAPALADSGLALDNGTLTLSVSEALRPLYTEGVSKDLRLLAEWLKAQPAVRFGDGEPESLGK